MSGGPARRAAAAEPAEFQAFLAELDARVQAAASTARIALGRNLLTRHRVAGRDVVVKSFGPGRWWRRGGHKAVASFDHAVECRRRGIGSPEPLAAQAAQAAQATKAVQDAAAPWVDHFCCALVPDCRTAWQVLDRAVVDPAAALVALARFIAAMHQAGVDHRDLTPGNVLLSPTGEHLLVDTNRMRFHPGPVPVAAALAAVAKLAPDGALLEPYLAARPVDAVAARRHFARLNRIERLTRAAKDATRAWRRRVGM